MSSPSLHHHNLCLDAVEPYASSTVSQAACLSRGYACSNTCLRPIGLPTPRFGPGKPLPSILGKLNTGSRYHHFHHQPSQGPATSLNQSRLATTLTPLFLESYREEYSVLLPILYTDFKTHFLVILLDCAGCLLSFSWKLTLDHPLLVGA